MTGIDKKQILKDGFLVGAEIEDQALEEFCELVKPRHFKSGGLFVKYGDEPNYFAIVVKGLLRAYYQKRDGTIVNKSFFPECRFVFPGAAYLLKEPNQIYIEALEDSECLIGRYPDLEKLYYKYPKFTLFALYAFQIEWARKERRETQMMLLDTIERYQSFKKEFPTLENRIAGYHIASYLGMTPVQLSRVRRALVKVRF